MSGLPISPRHLFRQANVNEELGTIICPNGADIDPGVLYDWPQRVDAIIQRRGLLQGREYLRLPGREL